MTQLDGSRYTESSLMAGGNSTLKPTCHHALRIQITQLTPSSRACWVKPFSWIHQLRGRLLGFIYCLDCLDYKAPYERIIRHGGGKPADRKLPATYASPVRSSAGRQGCITTIFRDYDPAAGRGQQLTYGCAGCHGERLSLLAVDQSWDAVGRRLSCTRC